MHAALVNYGDVWNTGFNLLGYAGLWQYDCARFDLSDRSVLAAAAQVHTGGRGGGLYPDSFLHDSSVFGLRAGAESYRLRL